VGFFNRKVLANNLALSEEEKSKYFASEIAKAVEAEYRMLEESVKESVAEGIHSQESEEFESKTRMTLDQICKFITRLLGEDVSDLRSNERVWPNWVKVKKLMDGLANVNSPKTKRLIADLEETCIYFADSVKSGAFVMMPDATIESSYSHRSYLLGNKLNGMNKWGWEKEDKSPQEIADNTVSQLLASFITAVHDKVGAGRILNSACLFVIVISATWEIAPERNAIVWHENYEGPSTG
jgi:hypothetical protein